MFIQTGFRVLNEIIQTGSFTRAAQGLGMSGVAVGKHVKQLESRLNIRLFQRTTRSVIPTEAALQLNEAVMRSDDYLNEVLETILQEQSTPSGRLKINVPMSYGEQFLAQPLAAYAALYPDVTLDVDFDDKRVHLIEDGYDAIVRIGVLEDSAFIAKRISDFPIHLCASPALVEKYGSAEHPRDIRDWPFICYSNASNPTSWSYTDKDGKAHTQHLTPALYANSAAMLAEACVAGVGLALLPLFSCRQHIEQGRLVHILPDYQHTANRGVYVIYPDKQFTPLRVRRFIDLLSEHHAG